MGGRKISPSSSCVRVRGEEVFFLIPLSLPLLHHPKPKKDFFLGGANGRYLVGGGGDGCVGLALCPDLTQKKEERRVPNLQPFTRMITGVGESERNGRFILLLSLGPNSSFVVAGISRKGPKRPFS